MSELHIATQGGVMTHVFQSDSIDQIATALAAAQAEIRHADKSANNPFFNSKYADLPSVMDAARPALAKNKLAVTQPTYLDENGKMFVMTQVSHASGQWMRSWYPVNPVKNDPQGLGSAITYARRYAYASIVGVASSIDDDDGNEASRSKPRLTAKARNDSFAVIKAALEESADPAATWGAYKPAIENFKAEDEQFYDDLVATAKKRKEELADQANVAASYGQDFANTK